jgi:hypothetical protein
MPDWLVQVISNLGIGIAVYTGIRVDLAIAKTRADEAVLSAKDAHQRIDRMYQHRRSTD